MTAVNDFYPLNLYFEGLLASHCFKATGTSHEAVGLQLPFCYFYEVNSNPAIIMSNPNPVPTSTPSEKTFKSFTNEQSENYAKARPTYHENVYKTVIDYHTSKGGHLDNVIDVGCGPGLATIGIAPYFALVTGLDPSEGMIETSRSAGGTSASGEPIRYEVSSAEHLGQDLEPPVANASVDLITAATAAHWFDMTVFWPRAAKVLKPGGTVAIWSVTTMKVHNSVPNWKAIQAALDENDEVNLKQHMEPGNILCRDGYVDLALPWTLAKPVAEFDKSTFVRKEFDSNGSGGAEQQFFKGQEMKADLKTLEMMWVSVSPVARWREAHPDTAGTDQDVVKMIVNKTKQLHEAGVEEGQEIVTANVAGVCC
jgi:trans-aconitate 3-methyltransferase